MGNLPLARLQSGELPFTHKGADCFGLFMIKSRRTEYKRCGCVFVCMTTTAIHLDVLPDMTTDAFINALRRFLARRGPVKNFYITMAAIFWAQNEFYEKK